MSSPEEPLQQFLDDDELAVETSDTDATETNSSRDVPLRDPNLRSQDQHVSGDSSLSTVENGSVTPANITNMTFNNSDETNTPYQDIPDEDDMSNLGIGGKLLSTKNSLELIPPRNHEKENSTTRNPEHAPITSVESEPLAGHMENNEFSKSVIQNLTNANIKANGHHVVWADTLDNNPFVIAKGELNNRMTILNPVEGEHQQNQNSNTGIRSELFSAYSFKSAPPQGNVTEVLYNSRNPYNDQEGATDFSRMERLQMLASQRSHQNSVGQLYQSQACRGNYQEEMGLVNTTSAQNIHLGPRCPSNNGEFGNADNAFTQTSIDVSEIPRNVFVNPSETCENLFEKLNGSDVQLQRSDHESQKVLRSDDCFDSVSDDDWIPDDKPSTLNLSVNYTRTPDPLFVSGCVDPAYHCLINQTYKKDCRTWLYKNKAAKAKVRARHQQVQQMLFFQKGG